MQSFCTDIEGLVTTPCCEEKNIYRSSEWWWFFLVATETSCNDVLLGESLVVSGRFTLLHCRAVFNILSLSGFKVWFSAYSRHLVACCVFVDFIIDGVAVYGLFFSALITGWICVDTTNNWKLKKIEVFRKHVWGCPLPPNFFKKQIGCTN